MKLIFGFLLKDKLHLEHQWQNYLEGSICLCHCYSNKYRGTIPMQKVQTQATNWGWTLLAHLELFKEFIKTDGTHLALLSESCIPLKSKEDLENYLQEDKSYFTGLNLHYRANDYRKRVYQKSKYFKRFVMHEQWTILSRKHILVLLENEVDLLRDFSRKFADNEHYSGTYLHNLGYTNELVNDKIHYIVRKIGAHPMVHKNLTKSFIDKLGNDGYFFLRKVDENTRIDNYIEEPIQRIESDINIQTFAIVHNQDLLLENHSVYRHLDNLTWLLVSENPDTDKLTTQGLIENQDYIVCNNLTKNIEKDKELLHYTAMYAIIENNLIHDNTDYIRFIEYDLKFNRGVKTYIKDTHTLIKSKPCNIYAHLEVPHRRCWYTPEHLMELNEKALKEKFNTKTLTLTRNSKQRMWMCSINFVMNKQFFVNFYNYITQYYIPYYKGERQAGNNLERAFTLYCYQYGISWKIIPGVSHSFSNSHGTS